MTVHSVHPSFLELDVHAVAPADDATARHVRDCQQCAAHVAAVRVPTVMPAGIGSLSTPEPRRAPPWRLIWATAALAVLSVPIGFKVLENKERERALIVAKGAPAASLWLKRGAAVTAWKGERLAPDAAVRWEIAPAGYTHVRVFDTTSNEVLYEAKVTGDAPVLTPAWTFDGTRATEKIRVVLTRDDAPLPADVVCPGGDEQRWCSEYVLELEPR